MSETTSVFDGLGVQVMGPTMELAAKVAASLAGDEKTLVKTEWGSFYVSKIELTYSSGGERETVGYLVPDEGEGSTFDFYTPTAQVEGECQPNERGAAT